MSYLLAGGPSAACDCYSLGATIYYLLTGQYLYDIEKYDTPSKVGAMMHGQQGFEFPDKALIPGQQRLMDVMAKLLKFDPRSRMTIPDLLASLCGSMPIVTSRSYIINTEQPNIAYNRRCMFIDQIRTMCESRDSHDSFGLAVSIMDKYLSCIKSLYRRHPGNLLEAFERLAAWIMYPDQITCVDL